MVPCGQPVVLSIGPQAGLYRRLSGAACLSCAPLLDKCTLQMHTTVSCMHTMYDQYVLAIPSSNTTLSARRKSHLGHLDGCGIICGAVHKGATFCPCLEVTVRRRQGCRIRPIFPVSQGTMRISIGEIEKCLRECCLRDEPCRAVNTMPMRCQCEVHIRYDWSSMHGQR